MRGLDVFAAEQATAPFFVYDLAALERHLAVLARADPVLWYACKANPLGAILDLVAAAGFGFDCASPGELAHVLARGVPGDRILLTGPGKTRAFLEQALEAGVATFVVESVRQLGLLDDLAAARGASPRVLLRLQLDWSEEGTDLLGGGGISVFGIEPERWATVDFASLRAVRPEGFHVFQWGNVLDSERLAAIWERIAEECNNLARGLSFPFRVMDLGGGLGIPYHDETPGLDWTRTTEVLGELRGDWEETWLEPGRFAVGPFGAYLARVVDRKVSRGEDLIVLEGGINHLLRPALTGQGFPCRPLRPRGGPTTSFRLHGPLCTALDFLGHGSLPADLEPGEWLVFGQCGAYGFTESMPYFLCHDLPGEAIWDGRTFRWERLPAPASSWLV